MSLTELLTLRPKKDLNECCCAGKQQIDVYRFGSVTTLCPWPAPRARRRLRRCRPCSCAYSWPFFWPSLIFALRSSRSLSRASLSSCAAKQNRHAFHFWVLAFKLFLDLNRATVLRVFVETSNRARGSETNHNRHRAREREKQRAWTAKLRLDALFPRFTFLVVWSASLRVGPRSPPRPCLRTATASPT